MFELTRWTEDDLRRFLQLRQEFFLDPMGSNKERFLEAAKLLQQALFDWYTTAPGKFEGMLSLVTAHAEKWSALRKEERRTLEQRRFALNNALPDTPAVESSVSENQWQRIFGSLGLGLSDPGTFDRFLVQLDEETNPSLRVNHRYLGELLPHDNMVSYLSSVLATFLNENAIIGKVSPCVTHMEEAAVHWLLTLVGWDGLFSIDEKATLLPLQRLPVPPSPNHLYQRWERDEPTGTVVAGGTIANISALIIARNAVFDYLLNWDGAAQTLGAVVAWQAVQAVWGYTRMVVLTSQGAHYSVKKAALQAGIAPNNVIEIAGSVNPYVLDRPAFEDAMTHDVGETDLVICVVPIAGKTETGYVDDLHGIAEALDAYARAKVEWSAGTPAVRNALPRYPQVLSRLLEQRQKVCDVIAKNLREPYDATRQFNVMLKAAEEAESVAMDYCVRAESGANEIENASHNRLFVHVDAAHGGGYLTVPALRHGTFKGIEHADTITIDGHKSLYCYYPCGGLLIRVTRWARTLATGQADYISEETNYAAYGESAAYFEESRAKVPNPEQTLLPLEQKVRQRDMYSLVALQVLTGRSLPAERSELTHQPFNQYLEGSRGPQGIMQLYFNLATLGVRGYRSILEWTCLLRSRCEEAISLGMSDVRLVTDPPMPDPLYGTSKLAAMGMANSSTDEVAIQQQERRVMPIGGGRFLRLSAGSCNQILMTYVPARESKLIASADAKYWEKKSNGKSKVFEVLEYLWRVNEHLWHAHIYANPNFTYYLGHTSHLLKLPRAIDGADGESRERTFVGFYESLNAWLRPPRLEDGTGDGSTPFLKALAKELLEEEALRKATKEMQEARAVPDSTGGPVRTALKFFCHKVIVMHPYTDESLLGDMLRRVAFWGERSVPDVRIADKIGQLIGGKADRSAPQ